MGVRLLLLITAVLAGGCAAADTTGSGETSTGSTSGGGSAAMGSGGSRASSSSATSSSAGGAGGAGGGAGTGGLMGDLAICVLNKGLPQDPCAMPAQLDYGTVPAGTQAMRLFRIDNDSNKDALFKSVTINDPSFSVVTVRYEVDPGDPNALIRVAQPLPATRPPHKALYFEVTFTSNGSSGPLPAKEVHVAAAPLGLPSEDLVVPIVGQTDGCPPGTAACDADPTNGCETDTNTSPQNCGGCNQLCILPNATPACQGGQCVINACNGFFADCNMNPADGCETNIFNDPAHCGSCLKDCKKANTTVICNAGNCGIMGCAMGYADCNLDPADGCETDITTSMSNCGGCNKPCDLANASESCTNGTCVLGACDAGFLNCDNNPANGCEIDSLNDPNNCNKCNKACVFNNAGATCTNGSCKLGMCNPGFENCNINPADGCEIDLKNDPQHCGGCGTDCNQVYQHSQVGCGAGLCQFQGCLPGYYDLDGNAANGCEYACNYVGPTDDPDDTFTDQNCDGIDGDITKGIFVSVTTGNNGYPGTMQQPLASVSAGISKAVATGKTQVYISDGIYNERVTLANGVSLYGGYSAANGWKRQAAYITTIRNSSVISGRVSAMEGSTITTATTVDRLTIQTLSTNSTGASSYAFYCTGCTGVTLKNSTLEAGNAGPGAVGTSGAAGASGGAGNIGGGGSCDANTSGGVGGTGGTSTCGRTGGNGGKGGDFGANSGANGAQGVGGTAGGSGGAGGNPGSPGGAGQNGAAGAAGTNGNGGSGGSLVSGFWQGGIGGNGGVGTAGNGAGGGGGGGGQGCPLIICNDGPGNGGGGGGAGGCGGAAGTGGTAGGGSFGLFLVSSTGFQMINNNISSGNGGNGGTAGAGGNGGSGGGAGGGAQVCTGEVGAGGNGGVGGAGGRGGHGGGGAGGVSYALYRASTSVNTIGNTLVFGSGGTGGTSAGNAGSNGAASAVF